MNPEDASLSYPMLKDGDWLRHQYLSRRKGIEEIKDIIGCNIDVLEYWFEKHGINIQNNVEYRELHNKEWLSLKYESRKWKIEKICEEVGCSERYLRKRLRKLDIDIRKEDRLQYPNLHDKSWMKSKYIEEDLTAKAISEQLGCAHGTVRDYLYEYGIHKRDENPHQLSKRRWLREQYVTQGKSDSEIADMLGVSRSMVRKARQEHDISPEPEYPKLRDKQWLKRKWEKDLLSPGEIGKLAGGAKSETVRDWLFKHDIL